jgi:hypothetical protein
MLGELRRGDECAQIEAIGRGSVIREPPIERAESADARVDSMYRMRLAAIFNKSEFAAIFEEY